jgi:hypothetical protein
MSSRTQTTEPAKADEAAQTQHIDDQPLHDLLAQEADQEEHDLGILHSLRQYPLASAWCVYACWTIILISFDVQAAGAIVGIPQFRKDFGEPFGDDYVLPAYWQSLFNAAPVAAYVQSQNNSQPSLGDVDFTDCVYARKTEPLLLLSWRPRYRTGLGGRRSCWPRCSSRTLPLPSSWSPPRTPSSSLANSSMDSWWARLEASWSATSGR